ncbi:mono-functional DNA-alkylating methyl methanesulfonate N-term-domain-containing protein [Apiospora marii]|uniref:mono-functional DNA-alkylating methyl methanesulfonate N-term-domain-containing protein n=1 Tax=Apiospora marii TaxID=335849 RepID=UPI00313263D7
MALQTNVFEGGQWVTRTLEPTELFKGTTAAKSKTKPRPAEPPNYGILTRTIIDSPVIRWVLPVHLRSSRNHDVAFIGDNFIQIRELGPDSQLHNVTRKADFGSRIRNARVIGQHPNYFRGYNDGDNNPRIKTEDDDVDMLDPSNAPGTAHTPPGALPRSSWLSCWNVEGSDGGLEFVQSCHEMPDKSLVHPGYHMAVDPSSRYLTLGCAQSNFIVYELESMDTLQARHAQRHHLNPIKSFRSRAINGVIHKLEFLYPAPENDYHIILMMIIIREQLGRVTVYDWELGEDLKTVLREEKKGYHLAPQWQLPLLIVPLTVRSSFMIITEQHSAVLHGLPHGPPQFEPFTLGEHEESEYHFGNSQPLWTAWTRPYRLPAFLKNGDVIYLAREDGIITFLEIGFDSELQTSTVMGSVDCNIDTAFGCVWDSLADVLVTGGDSGSGAIWNIEARERPRQIGTIPNWSPTVDLATTKSSTNTKSKRRGNTDTPMPYQQDRIFACSGRGKSGSITEFRHGLEASIGLEMDFEIPVKHCWPVPLPDYLRHGGLHLLLSSPNKSDLLFISDDFGQAELMIQQSVPYDLSSSTLACLASDDITIQVTTGALTIVTDDDKCTSTRHLVHEFAEDLLDASIAHAAIKNQTVGLALNAGSQFSVKTLTVDGLNVSQGPLLSIDGEVTCLILTSITSSTVLVAGVWRPDGPALALHPVEGTLQASQSPIELALLPSWQADISDPDRRGPSRIEAVTSIETALEQTDSTSLVLGTRSGDVFTVVLGPGDLQNATIHHDKFGVSAAGVSSLGNDGEPPSLFVCCNSELTVLRDFSHNPEPEFEEKLRVIPTKSGDTAMATPSIDTVARLPQNLTTRPGCVPVVMVSGTVIYIAELELQPKPVMRHFKLGRKPVKVLHSQRLNALLVVVADEFDDNRHSLLFIDADTGEDLSMPVNSTMEETDYISGLGDEDICVRSIASWRYQRDGREWDYIVLATSSSSQDYGRLLVISAEVVTIEEESGTSESHQGPPRRIRFWTKWRSKAYGAPMHSVTTDPHGVFLCAGTEVHYEIIDMVDRKLKTAKVHELGSPAQWMEVVDGKLHVVTSRESLEVLDYKSDPQDGNMIRLYSDDKAKLGLHCMEAGDASQAASVPQVTLLSDAYCGLWGLWQPPHTRTLWSVFLAELPTTIRRFGRCRSRPQWQSYRRTLQYDRIRSSPDDADIIGLAIDGSMHHFVLLGSDAWRLLRFIHNLALQSLMICPFFWDADAMADIDGLNPEPQNGSVKEKHVDGDILQRCYDRHALEELMADPGHYYRFRELLTALDQGRHVESFTESTSSKRYFELGYAVLRYYLSPVF